MVKIHQLLGMLLLLTNHACSYRLPRRTEFHDDHRDTDNALKIKMLRLLRYTNKINHDESDSSNYGLDEYEDYGYNFYPEQAAMKRNDDKSNRRGLAVPINYDYDFYDLPEPMKRNEMAIHCKPKPITANNYDSDEYDEKNDWGYDDIDYQKLLNNYIQRKSEHQNQHKTSKEKHPSYHHRLHSAKESPIIGRPPHFQHKLPALKGTMMYEYIDENDILDPPISHTKHKHKGFQLFMLNDDDDISASMVVDEVRPLRTTVVPKHAEFAQYEADAEAVDYSLPTRGHKFRRQQEDIVNDEDKIPFVEEIFVKSPMKTAVSPKHVAFADNPADYRTKENENNKYRRDQTEIIPSLIKIKASDIEQSESSINNNKAFTLDTVVAPKHTKNSDYVDADTTETEKVVHIPALKHTTVRNGKSFENKECKSDKPLAANPNWFATKLHHMPKVPKQTGKVNAAYDKVQHFKAGERFSNNARLSLEYYDTNNPINLPLKNHLTTSTMATSVAPKHAEFEECESSTPGKDYEGFLNTGIKSCKNQQDDDLSYETECLLETPKKCGRKKPNTCGKTCAEPDMSKPLKPGSTDYDLCPPKACNAPQMRKQKPTCQEINPYEEETTKTPCGTEKNPCKPTVSDNPCAKGACGKGQYSGNSLEDTINMQYAELGANQRSKPSRPFTQAASDQCCPTVKPTCPDEQPQNSCRPSANQMKLSTSRPYGNNVNIKYPNKQPQSGSKDDCGSKRPDGLTTDYELSSFTDELKLQKTPVEGGEDPLLSHLKQRKDNIAPLRSTLTTKFSDYGAYEMPTRSDKRSVKRQNLDNPTGVEIVDDYDEENLLTGLILPQLNNMTTLDESVNDASQEDDLFMATEFSSTTAVPKHFIYSDFAKTADAPRKLIRRDEVMDDEETLLEGLKLPDVENSKVSDHLNMQKMKERHFHNRERIKEMKLSRRLKPTRRHSKSEEYRYRHMSTHNPNKSLKLTQACKEDNNKSSLVKLLYLVYGKIK